MVIPITLPFTGTRPAPFTLLPTLHSTLNSGRRTPSPNSIIPLSHAALYVLWPIGCAHRTTRVHSADSTQKNSASPTNLSVFGSMQNHGGKLRDVPGLCIAHKWTLIALWLNSRRIYSANGAAENTSNLPLLGSALMCLAKTICSPEHKCRYSTCPRCSITSQINWGN